MRAVTRKTCEPGIRVENDDCHSWMPKSTKALVVHTSQMLLLAMFTSIYLKIHGFGLVHVVTFALALLAAARYRRIHSALPLLGVFGLLLIVQMIAVGDLSKDSLKYIVYMMTTMFNMIAILALFLIASKNRDGRILIATMLLMLLLAVLEVYGGMKSAFDAIRGFYTSDNSIYTSVSRDLKQYGQVRPNVFASEPSSLGNFFGALWLAYTCLVRPNIRNFTVCLFMILAALYIFRSPTLIGYLSIAPGLILIRRGYDRVGYVYLISLLLSVCFLLPYLWLIKDSLPYGPLRGFFETGSFFIRQISPLITIGYVIENAPILGLGSNFHEISRTETMNMLGMFFGGYYTPDVLAQMPARTFSSNALWEIAGTFGLLGTVILMMLLHRILKYFSVRKAPAVLLATVILATNHAGITLTFSWVPFLMISYAFIEPNRLAPKRGDICHRTDQW